MFFVHLEVNSVVFWSVKPALRAFRGEPSVAARPRAIDRGRCRRCGDGRGRAHGGVRPTAATHSERARRETEGIVCSKTLLE